MRKNLPLELRVGVDIGCRSHNVAIGLSTGEILEEFAISHEPEGFRQFFSRIEKHEGKLGYPVAVAMEGYNGYARPLDTMVRARDWRLFNINNLKLARFKEIFPGAAKTDEIDARKALELFQLRDHLPIAKDVLQEVRATPQENEILKAPSSPRERAGSGAEQPTGRSTVSLPRAIGDYRGSWEPVVSAASHQHR